MKAICQHTGIEFEAKSTRVKNHPSFAALLASANKDGVYGSFLDAVKANRDGITIEDCESILEQCNQICRGELDQITIERRAARRAASEARQNWRPSADHLGNEDARADIEDARAFSERMDARAKMVIVEE
jgi:hypothetical protein